MRISSFVLPICSVLLGIAGFFLRLSELANVFDSVTGLPERNALITIIMLGLTVAVLVAAIVFAIRTCLKYTALEGFDNVFGTDSSLFPVAFTLIGLVWIGATIAHYFGLNSSGNMPTTELIFVIISALSGISLIFFAIEMYKNPRRKMIFALSLIPALFMCYWLIMLYRENASNHVLLSYAYKCLAIISGTLGFYFSSGFVYAKSPIGKALISYVASIYFCIVTLADNHPLTVKLIFGSIIAINVLYSSMLISNLQSKQQMGDLAE